jgi:hypothetical protein
LVKSIALNKQITLMVPVMIVSSLFSMIRTFYLVSNQVIMIDTREKKKDMFSLNDCAMFSKMSPGLRV